MIRVYKNNTTDFTTNGICVLTDFKTSPKIKEQLNGDFELSFDYLRKGANAEYLVVDNIIKVPYDSSYQLFRIKEVEPDLTKINIQAKHIFYDLTENFLIDCRPTNKSGVNALNYILNNAMFEHKFTCTGDLIPDNTAYYQNKNIVEAILGSDNCLVNRWGGEIERNNFNIIYHKQRGEDKNVYIKYGKNIKAIKIHIDFTSVVTRIVPVGSDELMLPEIYVDSPIVKTYRNPIVKKVEFGDIGVDDDTTEEEAYEKLKEACNEQFDSGLDKPTISVSVDWLELSKMDEYKEKYSNFESVRLGDTVTVQALGYEYKIRVIEVEYDCLLNRYTKFEIGDAKANFVTDQVNTVENEIQKSTANLLERAKEAAAALINSGFGGYVRYYPDRILIMDNDDETQARNVWQWNINGFGHSSNGVNGDYGLAMTMDGQIVGDRITTGTIDVQRINGLATTLGQINADIELNEKNITSCVKYSDFNATKDTLNENFELLKQQQLEVKQYYDRLVIDVKSLTSDGVSKLKNTMFDISDDGMKIANDYDEFSALYNNKGSYLYSYDKLIAKYDKDGGECPVFSVTDKFTALGIEFEKESDDGEQVIMGHWKGW